MRPIIPGLLLLCVAAGSSVAQSPDFTALLSGKDAPSSLQLKELNGDWRRVVISPTGGSAAANEDAMKNLATIGAMSGGGGPSKDDAMGLAFISSLFGGSNAGTAYYTKGQTTVIGTETFLIAYQYEAPQPNFLEMAMKAESQGGQEPDIAALLAGRKMSPESTLHLSLVNVKNIGAMKVVRPFEMDKEIAESGAGGLLDMLALVGERTTVPVEPGPAMTVPQPPPTPWTAQPPVAAPKPQPKGATYWGNLGWDQYGKGQVKSAIASSRKALAMDGKLAYVRLNLGLYYAVLGNAAQSRKEYAAGIKMAGPSDIHGAIVDVNAALKKRPGNATLKQALRTLQAAQKKKR